MGSEPGEDAKRPPAAEELGAAGPAELRAEYLEAGETLARRIAGLAEAPMRRASLLDHLNRGGVISGVWTLEAVIRGALGRAPDSVAAYDCLLDPEPVAEQLGGERLRAMFDAGVAEGCVAANQWLGAQLVPAEKSTQLDPDRLVAWGLREMTLGDRRALARRAQGDVIDQLAVDPDPGVITNLLNNPRVTETVVLGICSRRPTVSGALVAVLRAPRWVRRYVVKLALVRNPHLELKFGVNLLVYLTRPDLGTIEQDGTLSPRLRLAAQRFLDLGE